VLANAVLAVCLAGCWGGAGTPRPAPTAEVAAPTTPSISPALAFTPTPELSSDTYFDAVFLYPIDPVPLPPGVVVYSRDARWEGAGGSLRRWYSEPSGTLRIDELLPSTLIGNAERALLNATKLQSDAWWVALCHGSCYGSPQPVTLRTSEDGGVTWRDVTTLEGGGGLFGAAHGIAFVVDATTNWGVATVTAGQAPAPVSLAPGINEREVRAFELKDSLRLVIVDDDRKTVRDAATGAIIATAPVPNPFQLVSVAGFTPGSDGTRLTVTWLASGDAATADQYLGFVDLATGKFEDVYRWKPGEGLGGITIAGWIADGVAIGRADLDAARYVSGQVPWLRGVPAIIDFNDGVVAPIKDFVEQVANKAGGPVPLEVETGSFARVVTGGSCLNVRPSPEEPPFECYADNVLLKLRGSESRYGEMLWFAVSTPDGRDGWAAAEFLETATTGP
jgi:hypothetical protein